MRTYRAIICVSLVVAGQPGFNYNQRMLANRSIPSCTVIPELPYSDIGAAISWLSEAFGFRLRLRIGDHRAQMNVGNDGALVLIEGGPEARSQVMVRVEDVDAHFERARQKGAAILNEPTTYPYGERQYSALDLAGHRWCFTQSVADVNPADWGGTVGEP